MDSYVIYAASNSDTDVFKNNAPNAFENRLHNQLPLDPNKAYEVCLKNIFLPPSYFAVRRNDPESFISVQLLVSNKNLSDLSTVNTSFTLKSDILASDNCIELTTILNREISTIFSKGSLSFIGPVLNYNFPDHGDVYMKYDSSINRIKFNAAFSEKLLKLFITKDGKLVVRISLSFGRNICKVIGAEVGKAYDIFIMNKPPNNRLFVQDTCYYHPRPGGRIDFLCVYCDKVQPTMFGNQIVNILDVVSFQSNVTHRKLYKPLNTTNIDGISIRLTDQDGEPVYFEKDGCTIAVLHIRPVDI